MEFSHKAATSQCRSHPVIIAKYMTGVESHQLL